MNNTVIIQKKPGFLIPKPMLEQAILNCPTVVGMALQDQEEGGQEILEVSRVPQAQSIDTLMQINEASKDLPLIISMTNGASDFDPAKDTLPFTIQAKLADGAPLEDILAVFLEGDFSGYSQPGSKHSDEYHLWNEFLEPILLEKLENKTLAEFFDSLKKSTFQQSIMNAMKHRGVALLMPIIGDTIAYGKNELGASFEWGEASQVFKYKEGGGAVEKVISATRGRLASIMGSTEKKATTDPAPTPAKTDPKPVIEDQPKIETPKTDTAVGTVHNAGKVQVKVPRKLQGNARNKWIRLFNNDKLPSNHLDPELVLWVPQAQIKFTERDVTTQTDIHNLKLEMEGKAPLKTQVIDKTTNVVDMKKAHETIKSEDKRPAADFLPVLSADDKSKSQELVLDWATRPADKTPSAIDIQKAESKLTSFSDQMGIKLQDMFVWQVSDIKLLAKEVPDALALAFIELRRKLIEKTDVKDMVRTAPPKKEETPITPPKEPEVPVAPKSRMASILGRKAG